MNGHGKKRVVNKSAQARQGSSFSPCPGCGTAVYIGLLSFHISSCRAIISSDTIASRAPSPLSREAENEQGGNPKSLDGLNEAELRQDRVKMFTFKDKLANGLAEGLEVLPNDLEEVDRGHTVPIPSSLNDAPEKEALDPLRGGLVFRDGQKDARVLDVDYDVDREEDDRGHTASTGIPTSRTSVEKSSQNSESPIKRRDSGASCGLTTSPETPMQWRDKRGSYGISTSPETSMQTRDRFACWDNTTSPETAMQYQDRVGPCGPKMSPPPARHIHVLDLESRKRNITFDDWGQALSPERESVHYVDDAPSIDSKFKKSPKAMKCHGRAAELVVDISQCVADEVNYSHPSASHQNEVAKEVGNVGGPQRVLELDMALRDFREKYIAAQLKEKELQRVLRLKEEECDELRRRDEQAQKEILSLNARVEKLEHQLKHDNEKTGTQLASQACNNAGPMSVLGAQDNLVSMTPGEVIHQERGGETMESLDAVRPAGFVTQIPDELLEPGHENRRIDIPETVTAVKDPTPYMAGHQLEEAIKTNGLIADFLKSFPPAQATESQGIDPFDLDFRGGADGNPSKVLDATSKDSTAVLDVDTLVKDRVEPKLSDPGRCTRETDTTRGLPITVTPQVLYSQDSEEMVLAQTRVITKRRKNAVVSESDSDGDTGCKGTFTSRHHPCEDSDEETLARLRKKRRTPVTVISSESDEDIEVKESGHEFQNQRGPSTYLEDGKVKPEHSGSPGRRIGRSSSRNIESECNSVTEKGCSSSDHILRGTKRSLPVGISRVLFASSPPPGCKRKLRKLSRVQGSPSANAAEGYRTTVEVEKVNATEEKPLRRSQRLRNPSSSKKIVDLSKDEEESYSDKGERNFSDRPGNCKSSEKHAGDDKEMETDSDSSNFRLAGKPRRVDVPKSKKHSQFQRHPFGEKLEVDDDEDSDDSSFINDDPESASDGQSSTAGHKSSDDGEGSESSGSASGTTSSKEVKKFSWEFEGDMLAALAKDSDLCLRGLCALFRRQEEDEKRESLSKYRNKRGFDKCHAARASRIAEFLMGRDSSDFLGPVVKTTAQLKEGLGEGAVSFCSDMCIHHSKQLFDIYKGSEDPHFPAA